MIRKLTYMLVLFVLVASICPPASAFREEIALDGVADLSGKQIASVIEDKANKQYPNKHIHASYEGNKLIITGDDEVQETIVVSITTGAIRGAVVGAITGGIIGGLGTRTVPGALAGAGAGAKWGGVAGIVAATLDSAGADKWYDEHIIQPIRDSGCPVM